jgi:hypothetical protein
MFMILATKPKFNLFFSKFHFDIVKTGTSYQKLIFVGLARAYSSANQILVLHYKTSLLPLPVNIRLG